MTDIKLDSTDIIKIIAEKYNVSASSVHLLTERRREIYNSTHTMIHTIIVHTPIAYVDMEAERKEE